MDQPFRTYVPTARAKKQHEYEITEDDCCTRTVAMAHRHPALKSWLHSLHTLPMHQVS